MNPLSFLKKQKDKSSDEYITPNKGNLLDVETDTEDDEINIGTKVKIIAAMLVVAVATYVALWVQEPTDIKVDLLQDSATVTDTLVEESVDVAVAGDQAFPTLAEVSIVDFTFTPANMTVLKGTTVVWTNMDPVDHTVTSDTFSSSGMETGDTFSYMFEEPGVYEYYCSFHPQMSGKIIVSDEVAAESLEDIGMEDEPTPTLYDETSDEYFSSLDQPTSEIGADLLTVESEPLALNDVEENIEVIPQLITFDATQLMEDEEALHNAAAVAAAESDRLAKSGPEDILYVGIFIALLYFNRRKLFGSVS